MDHDTPPPGTFRSRSPYLDRLNVLCQHLAQLLVGDPSGLPAIAAEVSRCGFGTTEGNLAGLTGLVKQGVGATGP